MNTISYMYIQEFVDMNTIIYMYTGIVDMNTIIYMHIDVFIVLNPLHIINLIIFQIYFILPKIVRPLPCVRYQTKVA